VGVLQEALVLLDLIIVQGIDLLEAAQPVIFALVAEELPFPRQRLFLLLGVFFALAGGDTFVDLTFTLALEFLLGLFSDVQQSECITDGVLLDEAV